MQKFNISTNVNMINKQISEIAQRLRGLRESLDYSADEMAKKTEISTDLYLKYESGDVDIPMNYLCVVAHIFNMDTAVLINGDETHAQTFFVTRKGGGVTVERTKAYKYRNLAGGFRNAKATPFLVSVEPKDGEITLNSHPGQEFNLVESGRMMLSIDGKDIVLEEGDSVYFDATKPHGMKALDGKKAHFLAIIL